MATTQKTQPKAVINIKTDRKLKERAQKTARKLGLPLGTILNRYLNELVREQRVTFEAPLEPNDKTARELAKAREDFRKGKNISPAFDDVEEAIEYLKSDS